MHTFFKKSKKASTDGKEEEKKPNVKENTNKEEIESASENIVNKMLQYGANMYTVLSVFF